MYHRFSWRHRRRIPEFLKKHRNIADSSSTHHRPITKAPLIFTDASPKHLWISVKNVEVSPTIINSSLAYHQLITNLSLTHHRFSLTHRWRIPEFLKKVDVSLTHQLITDLSSTHHWPITEASSIFIDASLKKHRRIADPSSTHHRPITDASLIFINPSLTHPWISDKNIDTSPTHYQLITDLYHSRIIHFHRRIPEKTSTHRWPIINSSPTYQWRTIDFHRSIADVSLNFWKERRCISPTHRLITDRSSIFIDASPTHPWISEKNIDVSATHHQLITNASSIFIDAKDVLTGSFSAKNSVNLQKYFAVYKTFLKNTCWSRYQLIWAFL